MPEINMVFEKIEQIKIPLIIAIANMILKKIQFVEQIDTLVKWDRTLTEVSPGTLAKAFILSTLFALRAPLSHISDRFRSIDTEYLFGKGITYKQINSYNIGRMLEKLGNCDCTATFSMISALFFKEFKLRIERLHADTTTISFYGDYTDVDESKLTEEEKEELLHIVRGYNKDGKPECNQVVVGQITNQDGIPVVTKVLDGNTSDVEWNKKALEYVQELINERTEEPILVADSKLIYEEIFKKMMEESTRVKFVSRCPSSFSKKLEERAIEKAYEKNQWEDIGSLIDEEKRTKYKICEVTEEVYGYETRLLVVISSALESTIDKQLNKAKEKLTSLIKESENKRFDCMEDALRELDRFKKKNKIDLFDCESTIEEEITEKKANGRPSIKNPKPVTKLVSYKLSIKIIGENPERVTKFRQLKSSFVIISNVDKGKISSRELLATYKGQSVVETSFRYFKDGALASVIYLKNPVRIEGMTMLLSVSLLIRGLVQYSMREGLRKYKEENANDELRIGWQRKPLKAPTYKLFFEASKDNFFLKVGEDKYNFNYYDDYNKLQVGTLLKFMGFKVEELL